MTNLVKCPACNGTGVYLFGGTCILCVGKKQVSPELSGAYRILYNGPGSEMPTALAVFEHDETIFPPRVRTRIQALVRETARRLQLLTDESTP